MATTRLDSAGVSIRQYADLGGRPQPRWIVLEPARARLGGSSAPRGAELSYVSGARVLSDGRIAVADGLSKRIQFYDSSGRPVGTAGREGRGPGEYLSVSLVDILPGDSLVVFDWGMRRVSVLASDGTFVRSFPLPDEITRFVRGVGTVPGGYVVIAGDAGLTLEGREHLVRDTVPALVLAADGEFVARFADRPAEAAYEGPAGHSPRALQVPFMPGAQIAAGASGVYVGHDQRFEIRRFDAHGALQGIIRATVPRMPVSPAELDSVIEKEARMASNPEGIRSLIAMMPVPTEKPPHGQIAVDRAGGLWVRRSEQPDEEGARWLVFTPGGGLVGEALLPVGEVLDIGEEYVLLLTWDALDVPEVTLYGLVRRH